MPGECREGGVEVESALVLLVSSLDWRLAGGTGCEELAPCAPGIDKTRARTGSQ